MDVNVDRVIELLQMTYNWISYTIPMPWLAFLQSAVAAWVGYLIGQFALAERMRREGYDILTWYDERRGRRRYMVQGNGLEMIGEDDEDVDESLYP